MLPTISAQLSLTISYHKHQIVQTRLIDSSGSASGDTQHYSLGTLHIKGTTNDSKKELNQTNNYSKTDARHFCESESVNGVKVAVCDCFIFPVAARYCDM